MSIVTCHLEALASTSIFPLCNQFYLTFNATTTLESVFTGQMQNLIAVGPRTPPLLSSHAILYSDARAQEAAADLSTQCSTSIDATSILAKLTLLPTHSSPSDYSLLLGAADYIIHHFCNSPKPTVTDATTASTTGLTLPPHRTYNTLLLQEANLAHFESLLPRILSSPCIVGHLSLTIAQRLDKPSLAGTPLIHAGGDAYSTTAGAERETPGGAYVYCGTSGWIGGTTLAASPTHNGVFALGHAADSRLQIALASLATAGGNVSFAAKTLLGGVNENLVCNMADQAPIGANGVMYIPYICGRRCPNPCATMSGTLVGLRGSTTRRDVARAVVEGIVFAYAEAAEVLEKGILDGEMLRMVGGGARCGVVVRGIASLIGKNGGVVLEKGEGGYVGVRGCGKIGAEVVCGERGMDWWRDGEIVKVGEGEKREWMKAWRRWRRALERVEGV